MKKNLTLLSFAIFMASFCNAQQTISIGIPASGKILSFKAFDALGKDIDVSNLNTTEDIIIKPDAKLTNIDYELHVDKADGNDVTNAIMNKTTGNIVGNAKGYTLFLTIKVKNYDDLLIQDIGKNKTVAGTSGTKKGTTTTSNKGITATDYIRNYFNPTQYSFHNLKNLIDRNSRYSSSKNEAFIILDENGKLIGNVPANIDQDDYIYIYMIIDVNDIDKYDLEAIGEYEPVDLQIRSYEPINKDIISAEASKLPNEWTVIRFERGPYTSNNVTFNIKKTDTNKDNETETKTLSTYTLKVNKLFHVAIGASFVTTSLAKPDFDVFPLTDTTNTINTLNGGPRTLFTFNVVWYWQNTFKYFKGSDLTRGRDILKEPNLFTRLNPTFGVALDNTFRENFFAGFTYEFARGGSICLGGHYGKVKELATKAPDGSDFELGKSVYRGTVADIKLSDAWKWGAFIGITLDTRIFNKLLSRN